MVCGGYGMKVNIIGLISNCLRAKRKKDIDGQLDLFLNCMQQFKTAYAKCTTEKEKADLLDETADFLCLKGDK